MCAATPPGVLTLSRNDRSAGVARSFLSRGRCTAHGSEVLDDAQLLLSELVANAVRHGAPPITVRVSCDGHGGMTVAVTDRHTQQPHLVEAGPLDETGRGLALVDRLSDAWGVEPADDGKTVWFRLHAH